MAHGYDTLMTPAIEDLLDRTESKFVLVTLAAMRCREITDYKLGSSIGSAVPPQVLAEESSKYLSIALEEIAVGKIEAIEIDPDAEFPEDEEDLEMLAVGESPEGAHLHDVSDPEQALAAAESPESAGGVGT